MLCEDWVITRYATARVGPISYNLYVCVGGGGGGGGSITQYTTAIAGLIFGESFVGRGEGEGASCVKTGSPLNMPQPQLVLFWYDLCVCRLVGVRVGGRSLLCEDWVII